MKKIMAFILAVCMYLCVLTACEEDESFVSEYTPQTLTGESDTVAHESHSETESGEDVDDTEAEQTFGGLQELKPLN